MAPASPTITNHTQAVANLELIFYRAPTQYVVGPIVDDSKHTEKPLRSSHEPGRPAQGIDTATEECKIGTVHIPMYETRQNNRM